MRSGREVKADKTRGDRRSIRLRGFDYSQVGTYFVTICTLDRTCLFGEVVDGAMRLNAKGTIVDELWREIPEHFSGALIDEYVIMPNHLHGILVFMAASIGAPGGVIPTTTQGAMNRAPTLGEIVRAFKARVTREVGSTVWQRNYYEHIVRDDISLSRIRQYILANPARWELDRENPTFVGARFIAPYPAVPNGNSEGR